LSCATAGTASAATAAAHSKIRIRMLLSWVQLPRAPSRERFGQNRVTRWVMWWRDGTGAARQGYRRRIRVNASLLCIGESSALRWAVNFLIISVVAGVEVVGVILE
ncbi:MAG TPA: hypothetical protein VK864_06535, partial [Longimicrobiales bacterium]|nr:hypothetical protein [Longimicrobiales bacterium]